MKYVDIDGKEIPDKNAGRNRSLTLLEWGCTAWAIVLAVLFFALLAALLFQT